MQSKQCNCADAAERTSEIEGLPRWGAKLAHRLATLEKKRAHTLIIIVPEEGEPQWSIQATAKIEN